MYLEVKGGSEGCEGRKEGTKKERTEGSTEERKEGGKNGRTDGRTERRKDGEKMKEASEGRK